MSLMPILTAADSAFDEESSDSSSSERLKQIIAVAPRE